MEAGTKVLIVEDCRPDIGAQSVAGQTAICEGDFPARVDVFFNVGGDSYWVGIVDYTDYASGRESDKDGVPMKDSLQLVTDPSQEEPTDLQLFGKVETSPRLRLSDGNAIWGHECWWVVLAGAGTLEEEQAKLRELQTTMHQELKRGEEQ